MSLACAEPDARTRRPLATSSASDELETEIAQLVGVCAAEVVIPDHRSAWSIGVSALHDHPYHRFG